MKYKATFKHPNDLARFNYLYDGNKWVSQGQQKIFSYERDVIESEVTLKDVIKFFLIMYVFVFSCGYITGFLSW